MSGKKSKTNEPMRNIMKSGEWRDADTYRIACDCHSSDHDLNVWIEIENDNDTKEVVLTFYKELYTPFWTKGFNRVREALRVLFLGYSRHEGSIIMRREVAENFLDVVKSSINRLEKKSNDNAP